MVASLFDPASAMLIAVVFLLAGTVKGVVGLGLPTVSLGLLTAAFDLTTAMALMVVPSFVTNLLQAVAGGNWRMLVRRLWPFFAAAGLTVWVGAAALVSLDLVLLSGLLGLLLAAYAVQGLAGVDLSVTARWQPLAGPAFGAANGVLTGMTGSFVVPGVLYLQAIGLGRDALVQAMGMLFTVSTVALAVALEHRGLLGGPLGLASAVALLPAVLGMALGQLLRRRLPEARFRRVFFLAVLALGLYIAANAALGLGGRPGL
ncbi:MAG: sulfite exporter TauE/SafE family protein [Alphaproteobacteria bacterium]|nr:sulfite exporter TauE/SafE family protein [Alphaproteobacteria bacterium]